MVDVTGIIVQNIDAAIRYIEVRKFDSINIIGNRILQELFSINKKDRMLIGLLVKEVSSDLLQTRDKDKGKGKGKDKSKLDAELPKSHAIAFLEELKSHVRNGSNPVPVMDSYIKFESNIHKYLQPPEERDVYKENDAFAVASTIGYLKNLLLNKNLLIAGKIAPLERARSDLAVTTTYYGSKEAVVCYLLLRAFEHTYRFMLYGKLDLQEITTHVNKLNDTVTDIITLIEEGGDYHPDLVKLSDTFIADLMYDYRGYYSQFGDLKGDIVGEVPLSPDVSEKIRKIVEKQQTK